MSLEDDDYAAPMTIAEKSDLSISWVIRQTIYQFVQKHGAQPDLPLRLSAADSRKGQKT